MKRILDLFCCAGGAAAGIRHAFPKSEIVGVDINPQPHYPFTLVQGNCLSEVSARSHYRSGGAKVRWFLKVEKYWIALCVFNLFCLFGAMWFESVRLTAAWFFTYPICGLGSICKICCGPAVRG